MKFTLQILFALSAKVKLQFALGEKYKYLLVRQRSFSRAWLIETFEIFARLLCPT